MEAAQEPLLQRMRDLEATTQAAANGRRLIEALCRKDRDAALAILDDVQLVDLEAADQVGMTPLHHASRIGFSQCIQKLLDADVTLADKRTFMTRPPAGWMPLNCLADAGIPKDAQKSDFCTSAIMLVQRMSEIALWNEIAPGFTAPTTPSAKWDP